MNPILVTGAAKGLGGELCRQLASHGHDVVIHFRESETYAEERVQECLAMGVKAEKIHGDFSSEQSLTLFLDEYLRRFVRTKGLINNVGNYLVASTLETPKKEWYSLTQENLLAPILISQALISKICREEGTIINMGVSGLNPLHAKIKAPAYTMTKLGLWGFTLSLAKELACKNVTVNMVSPGFMESSIDLYRPEDLPMKRPATLQEVAQMVVYLFKKEGHYITGQNIEVAGGHGL